MSPKENFSAFEVFFGAVNSESGLISGVSVITQGVAKGHNKQVDFTTLEQVKKAAEAFKKGLKVKMDHHSGISDIVGYLRNFRIDGDKLVADLQLLRTHPQREYIMEIAQEISDGFGLSISFSGEHEQVQGVTFARCSEIYSADLVTEPAANSGGLFEKPQPVVDTLQKPNEPTEISMTPEQLQEAIKSALEPLSKKIVELETKAATPAPAPVIEKTEEQKKAEFDAQVAKEVAVQMSKIGVPPVAPAAPAAPAPEKKTFLQLVDEKAVELKSRAKAMSFCVEQFPNEYTEYRKNELKVN